LRCDGVKLQLLERRASRLDQPGYRRDVYRLLAKRLSSPWRSRGASSDVGPCCLV